MNINNDMMLDLAEQLGLSTQGKSAVSAAERKAEAYKDKSDEEILREIGKLKETIKKDRKAYDQQIATIKSLSGMMNKEQKARLEKIIELLES